MKIVSGRIAVTTIARSVRVPGVSRPSPNAVLDTQLRREPQMHLDVRLGVLFDERADPARLRSRQKLTHHLPTFAGRAEQPLPSPPPLLCEKTRATGDQVTSMVPRRTPFAHSLKEIGGTARASRLLNTR